MKGKTFQLFSIALALSVVTFFGFSADAYGQTSYALHGNSDDSGNGINLAAALTTTLADGDTVYLNGHTLDLGGNLNTLPNLLIRCGEDSADAGAASTLLVNAGAAAQVTIKTFAILDADGTINLDSGNDIAVTDAITIGTGRKLTLDGGNVLVADVTIASGGELNVITNANTDVTGDVSLAGKLDVDVASTVTGDFILTGAADTLEIAAGVTLTLAGGDLKNTVDAVLTGIAGAGGTIDLGANAVELGAGLTFDSDGTFDIDATGILSLTATADATLDADGVATFLTLDALTTFGGDPGATLTLLSAASTDTFKLTDPCTIHNLTIDGDEVVDTDNGGAGNDVNVADGYVLTFAADAEAGALTLDAAAGADLVINGKVVYLSTTADGIAAGGGTIVLNDTLQLGSDVCPTDETSTFAAGATVIVDGSGGARAATLVTAGAHTITGAVDFVFDATGGTASLALAAPDFDVNANSATFYISGTNAASLTVGGAGDALIAGAAGSIVINGAAGTSLTIDEVELDGAEGTIVPNADVTITSLTLTGANNFNVNFGGGILTVGSNVDPTTGSLTLGGVGSGSLRPADAADDTLDLTGPATLTANNIGLLVEMDVNLGGGIIDVDKDLTLSGDITGVGAATIDINAAATLEYTGADVTVGANTLTLPGGGTFNHTNDILLNDLISVLFFANTDGTELNTVIVSDDAATIVVNAGATIADLQLDGSGAVIDFGAAKTLILVGPLTVNGGDLSIVGTAAGTLTSSNSISVTGNNAVALSGASAVTVDMDIILNNSTGASITTTGASHELAGNITTNKQATITVAANAIDISGDIVVNDTLTINKALAITYTGADIAVGTGQLLKLQGAGAFDGTEADEPGHDIILDGSAVLDLEGTGAVDTVDILSQDVVVEVDASPVTVSAFRTASNGFHLVFTTTAAQLEVVAPITVDIDNSVFYVEGTKSGILYGAGGISLTGADAKLQIDNTATPNINKQITLAGGGVLKINQAATFGQTITLSGDATFDIASGQVFSYNKDPLNIGAATLTIMGGGTLNNTGTGIVVLNDAASVLAIAGGATATTVNLVTLGVADRPIRLDAGDGTITTFNRGTLDVTFEINSTGTLTVPALTFSDNETLTLTGTGAGTLDGGLLTVTGESATLLVTNSGGMTIDNAVNIGNAVEHALLDINNDAGISGNIVLLAEADFDVNSTLTYTGADINVGVGDTLFVTGSGDIDLGSNAVVLSAATSVIHFTGTSSVSKVESGDDAATITVSEAGAIDTLTYTAAGDGVTFDFRNTSTFTLTDTTTLGNAAVMLLKGEAEGTLAGTGAIKVTGEAAAIEIDSTLIISKPILIGNAVTDAILDVDIDATISGYIMLAANATFDVLAAMTLDYTGGAVNVGANTLTLLGIGEFANTSAIVLDDAASVLDFTAAMTVDMVESGDNGATIDVGAAGTIEELSFTGGLTFDFTTASTFTVDDASALPGGAVLTIGGAADGTLAGIGDAVVFGDSDTLRYDDAGIGISLPLAFGGAEVTPSVLDINDVAVFAGEVDFAGYVDFLVADTLTLSGDVTTSGASVLSASAVDSVILTGTVDLAGDLTFDGVGFDITGITALTATSNSTFTADSSVTFTAMANLGTAPRILTLAATGAKSLITIPNVTIDGTVSLAGDDTLKFDGLVTMAGNVEMNGTGKLVIVPDAAGLTITATLQAVTGLIEIDSVGTAGQGNITLAAGGVYKVNTAAGEIILPRTKETTVTGGIIVLTNGILRGGGPILEGEEQHTITAATYAILQATVVGMTGGIIHNLEFDPSIMAFTTMGTNVDGYSITVYVNFYTGDDATGDGSLVSPYKTLEKGYAEAVDMGIVSVAAATYTLTAQLIINKEITLTGTKLDGTTDSWTGAAGAADEAPTITYSGASLAGLFVIAADNVTIQGLKIDMVNDVSRGIEFADAEVDNISITYNTFMMDDGDKAISVDDGGTVTNLGIMWNSFMGMNGNWFFIGEMDSVTVDDVDATNNVIESAAAQLRLGKGAISDISFMDNTFMNNNGIKLLEPVEQSDGMFSDISVTGNKFKGDMDYAFLIADDVENADFDGDLYDEVTVNNNHFFFASDGDYAAVSNLVTDASTSINAENNWWGSIEGPNQTGGADVSANVDYTVWKFLPELAGNEVVISAVSGGQRSGIPIYATVYAGFAGAVEFGTINFDATTSGLFAVEANNPDAYAEQTFMITPNNTAEVTDAQITVFDTDDPTVMDVSNVFDITVLSAADINAIGTLTAIDNPFDGGGYVVLEFVASPNHPGYTTVPGYVGDTAPIDYYQIYRSTTGSFEQAIHWSVAAATPKAQTQVTDTVRILVSTAGDLSGNATYYVTAVKGDLPPPLTTETPGAAAKAGVLVAYKPALAKAAGDDASFTSEVSNGDRAIGAKNTVGLEADFNSDLVVNLADFDLFVWAFMNDEEYDPLFEIATVKNDIVDLPDFDIFVSQFGMSVGAQRLSFSDGLNPDSWFEFMSEFDYDTELLELQVMGNDFTSLAGYGFDLVFDPEQFEIIEVHDGGFLESQGGSAPLFINYTREDGRVSIANILANRDDSITPEGGGVIAVITLHRTGNVRSGISIENVDVIDHAGELNSLEKVTLDDAIPLPVEFELKGNYPNPFNPVTTIEYTLPTTALVKLVIYNSVGQVVKTLVSEEQQPDVYKVTWDSTNEAGIRVASGLYIYKITAGSFSATKKMTLIK